jgi:hypothetical protein
MVEHVTFNHGVEGSIPSALTKITSKISKLSKMHGGRGTLPASCNARATGAVTTLSRTAYDRGMPDRPTKITLREMRLRHPHAAIALDYYCSHSAEINSDRWPDEVRLSDLEARFVCTICGLRVADVRPNWNEGKRSLGF